MRKEAKRVTAEGLLEVRRGWSLILDGTAAVVIHCLARQIYGRCLVKRLAGRSLSGSLGKVSLDLD